MAGVHRVYLAFAGAAFGAGAAAGVAGAMPPIICVQIAGSKGLLAAAGAACGAGAAAGAGIMGKKGKGAACVGAGFAGAAGAP